MRQRPAPRARLATVAWAVALLVLVVCGLARADPTDDASPHSRALRTAGYDAAQAADDQEARRITDCARFHALTPEQVAVFMRDGGRRLSCPLPIDSLPDQYKTPSEKERKAAAAAAQQQRIHGWETSKTNPTPEQIKAQAAADAIRMDADRLNAAAGAATTKYKDTQAANHAAAEADAAARQQQLKDVAAKDDAATSAEQASTLAADKLSSATTAKQRDVQQAEADAAASALIVKQRDEWTKQAEADAAARAEMLAQLKAIEARRKEDVAQAEADRAQAEKDKQLADDALRQQHATERAQRAAERQQRESEAAAQQKKFSADEEARLQHERDAKAAAAKSAVEEAEIKMREEARVARAHEVADAEVKAKEAEAEFQRKKAEQVATQQKFDELEKQWLQREQERLAAEAKAQADKDQAAADAHQKEEELPEEEKPKRHDEEDCAPSPVGSPPKCEGGGRCYQIKGKPESQRCSCGKGYMGDKCEHKPCPPPAKEGNIVNGKCVKWESEYFCPGCNKIWDMNTTCHEIDTKTSAKKVAPRKTDCKGLKEPENELYNRMCKFCLDGSSVKDVPGLIDKSVWEDGGDEKYDEDDEDESEVKENAETTADRASVSSRHRHRQLAPSPAPSPNTNPAPARYRYVPPFTVFGGDGVTRLFDVPAQAFVYSQDEHRLVEDPATIVRGFSEAQCIASCYQRMGSVGVPTGRMHADHCSWVIWEPEYTRGNTPHQSSCRIYNGGTFPQPAPRAQVLPMRAAAGMFAFLTYPRVYEMFRPTSTAPLDTSTYQVDGTTDSYVATFSRSARPSWGHGTYVTKNAPPSLRNCLVTARTRWEARWLYDQRVPVAGNRVYDPRLAGLRGDYPRGLPHNEPISVQSTTDNGAAWDYTFDTLLRVVSVTPTAGRIAETNIGRRWDDSPNPFQKRFSQIMRTRYFMDSYRFPPTHAGHLVAGSQRPPNWFFNYVPQAAASNSNGCWYYAEVAAKTLLRLGCQTTYGIGLTYRPTARFNTERDCYNAFRPTKMSLNLRILDGAGNCESLDAEWRGRPLVTYDARLRQLTTTRLMAHTLHRAVFPSTNPSAVHARDLKGFLHVATALPEVDKCDAETGTIAFFGSLTLTPEFTRAKLLMAGTCLKSRVLDGYNVLESSDNANCEVWSTRHGPLPSELTNPNNDCITMVTVTDPTNPPLQVDVAALVPAIFGGCLRFVYADNPFTALTSPPARQSSPSDGTAETTRPSDPMRVSVDALVTGYVGNVASSIANGGLWNVGQLTECLVYNQALQAFELVDATANPAGVCASMRVTQTV